MEVQIWPIEKLIFYARNPRKNDAAVDRMVTALREFGFKIPILARSDGEVVDGELRLKAARKLSFKEVPVILCDEWSAAQVKALRLLVNRSANWAVWDEELLASELKDLSTADIDLSLTRFEPHEIDALLDITQEWTGVDDAPPLPENPVSRPGDLWLCGSRYNPHRVLCGDSTDATAVARLLVENKPKLLLTDPPYGIKLDSAWRDRTRLSSCGTAKPRTAGHTKTSIAGDTRADWSEAFAVPGIVPAAQISRCVLPAAVGMPVTLPA